MRPKNDMDIAAGRLILRDQGGTAMPPAALR